MDIESQRSLFFFFSLEFTCLFVMSRKKNKNKKTSLGKSPLSCFITLFDHDQALSTRLVSNLVLEQRLCN